MTVGVGGTMGWMRRFLVILVIAWIPAFVGTGAIEAAAELFPVAMSGNPYFVFRHGWLLYVWVPLVVASSCVLLLSPGLLFALVMVEDLDLDRWVLFGFAISLVVVSFGAGLVQAIAGSPLTGRWFAAVPAALSGLAVLWLSRCVRRGREVSFPDGAQSRAAIATYLIPAVLLLVLLLPKFLWESFSGDGIHAFEATRLLLGRAVPFWDSDVGVMGRFPGPSTLLFTYPASWFMRLFGTNEASVRLPFILHMLVLNAAILGLVRCRAGGSPDDRKPGVGSSGSGTASSGLSVTSRWLLWLGLAAFSLAMAFSATYNPYHADIALPGVQDALLMACYLGFIGSFLRDERSWTVVFLVLTALTQASWSLLAGLWLLSVVLVWRPVPWRRVVVTFGLVAAVAVGLALLPPLFRVVGLPPPGAEHETGTLIEKLQFIRLDHWAQFLFVLIPCGILPALYLVAWRRQDRVARTLTIATALYFAFFYVQAYVSLHYFVPAMILPLVVLWRAESSFLARRSVQGVVLLTGVVALWLATPSNPAPHVHARTVGSAILDERGGYERHSAGFFEPLPILWELFRRPSEAAVVSGEYGGAPPAWSHYGQSAGERNADQINYILQPEDAEPPEDTRLVSSRDGVALYVRSDSVWLSHLDYRGPRSVASPLKIPRTILFRGIGRGRDGGVIDVKALLNGLPGRS